MRQTSATGAIDGTFAQAARRGQYFHRLRRHNVLFWLSPGPGHAAEKGPIVVELFTSQGCSSCPPANANLATIADRPDVLALSFGVTYWDYLGWKDSFAKPEFTSRQYAYEHTLHRATAYTPQMVVNGGSDLIGNSAE